MWELWSRLKTTTMYITCLEMVKSLTRCEWSDSTPSFPPSASVFQWHLYSYPQTGCSEFPSHFSPHLQCAKQQWNCRIIMLTKSGSRFCLTSHRLFTAVMNKEFLLECLHPHKHTLTTKQNVHLNTELIPPFRVTTHLLSQRTGHIFQGFQTRGFVSYCQWTLSWLPVKQISKINKRGDIHKTKIRQNRNITDL